MIDLKLKHKVLFVSLLVLSLGVTKTMASSVNGQQLAKQAEEFQAAYALAQKGDLQQALQSWQKLSKTEPMIPELQRAIENNIAVILMNQGDYDAAKNHFDKAIKADAQLATTIENLNRIYAYDARKAYQKIFKNTEVSTPVGEMLYFDIKKAHMPNENVITDIQDADAATLVLQQTEAWRLAWQKQDIEAYLSFYDSHAFIPKNGQSFETWKQGRYRSVQGPEFIKVDTDNVKAAVLSADLIRVNFYQRYESDRFKDDIEKALLWQKSEKGWKIIQEVVIYTDE